MSDNYRDELYHYGIKGQKWGVRRKARSGFTVGGERVENESSAGTASNDSKNSIKRDKDGKRIYNSWKEMPDDPNGEGYMMYRGQKVQKVEDGTAMIRAGGKIYYGDNPTQAYVKMMLDQAKIKGKKATEK